METMPGMGTTKSCNEKSGGDKKNWGPAGVVGTTLGLENLKNWNFIFFNQEMKRKEKAESP